MATKSGGSRLIASGKKPILLGPSAEEKLLLESAAKKVGVYTTEFVLMHALRAAKRILAKRT